MSAYRNNKGRFCAPTPAEKDVDIRKQEDVGKLESMLKNGAPTFVLIYADWCGHCHRYLPTWSQFEDTPGRTVNMARVHYDMQEHVPAIKTAKIQGYPSVIKVLPDGRIQSYPAEGEATNAVPYMRDEGEMKAELQGRNTPADNKKQSGGAHSGSHSSNQNGGASIMSAFMSAIQQAGPAALLLLANGAMKARSSQRTRTYKSPKRASRRASTRRSRRH